jgi:hypothetical protein
MKLINKKLYALEYALKYTSNTVTGEAEDILDFKMLSEAPWFIRLLSRGNYCAYGTTIYVPSLHLELIKSKHDEDRGLATAKILPYVMAIHDNDSISFTKFLELMFSTRYQAHYFIYEFLFLKMVNHQFKEVILTGFLTSRRNILGFKRTFESVEAYIQAIFKEYAP